MKRLSFVPPRPRTERRALNVVTQALGTALVIGTLLSASLSGETRSQEELDAWFAETMTGAHLEGQFSVVSGAETDNKFNELYMVSELTRGEGSTWIFTARMKYGENAPEAEFPIPVTVKWAGDTPVITMEEQTVEGLGTFTVRLLLHGDRYAGTWQHGAFGGHMWGKIVKSDDGP